MADSEGSRSTRARGPRRCSTSSWTWSARSPARRAARGPSAPSPRRPPSSARSASAASSAWSSSRASSAPSAGPSTTAASALDTAAGLARALVEGVPGQAPSPARARGGARRRRRHRAPACARCTSRCGATRASTPAASTSSCADDPALRTPGGASAAPDAASESEEPITYGRLRDEAAAVAGGLRERGVARGDTVALMLPTGLDFLRSFFGILLARAIPVPIYPPVRLDRLEEYAARQSAILADAGVRLLVTIPRARPVAGLLRPAVKTLADVVTADELAASGAPVSGPEGDGDDPAFIQYTSGSTGQPKGVLLTHDNLLANVRAIAAGLEVRPTDVGVSWLPLYHDMGLIGSWLTCLHHGLPLTLLPPTAFLARPERWLWAIHQRRATLSAAPNFAYELCARRIPDAALEGLDLSSWRVALNGAEPVSRGTIERFARRFSPCGFRPEAMMPVYGLAECSVGSRRAPVGRGPKVDRVAREPFQREGRAEAAAAGDADRPRVRLGGARAAGARGPHRGRRRRGRRRARGGPARLPRALDDERLLPPARGHRRDHASRRLARQRGPRLPRGRRDPRLRPAEGPHHQGRPQPRARRRSRRPRPASRGSGAGCVVAFGVPNAALGTEGLVVVAETRVDGRGRAGAAGGGGHRARGRGGGRAARPGRPRAAGRGAEDLERQGAPRGDEGAVPGGAPSAARRARRSRRRPGSPPPPSPRPSRPWLWRARGAGSTRRGSPSPCRCCSFPTWLLVALRAEPPLRLRPVALRRARGPPASSAAVSRPRASSGCPAAGRWCWPRTTPPTPTWPRSSPCCPPTSCSWPSARCSAIP